MRGLLFGVVASILIVSMIGFASAGFLCNVFGVSCDNVDLSPKANTERTSSSSGSGGGGGGNNNTNITCYNNAQCGTNYTSYFCNSLGQACFSQTIYTCVNPGTPQSFCSGGGGGGCGPCTYGCSGGQCINNQTNLSHLECVGNSCLLVLGSGNNECSSVGTYCTNTTSNMSKPDLVPVSFSLTMGGCGGGSGGPVSCSVYYEVKVKNVGHVAIPATVTRVSLVSPVMASALGNSHNTPSLSPGQTTTLTGNFSNIQHGQYTATSIVDWPSAQQNEISEVNNARADMFFT